MEGCHACMHVCIHSAHHALGNAIVSPKSIMQQPIYTQATNWQLALYALSAVVYSYANFNQ